MNSLSVALRSGYLSVRTAEGPSEKQSSLKACLRNGLTYLLTYLKYKMADNALIGNYDIFAPFFEGGGLLVAISGQAITMDGY